MFKNYIDFKIIPEKKLIIEYFSGEITIEDIVKLKLIEIEHQDYNNEFNLFSDFRDGDFNIDNESIPTLLNNLELNNLVAGKHNTSLLTKSPNQVVASTLLTHNYASKNAPIDIKIFSTVPPCLSWIGLSAKDAEIIDFYSTQMKNNTK